MVQDNLQLVIFLKLHYIVLMTIKTAIIPAAGLGTRFLPATKMVPKELLPIVNRPAIEYVVDELIDSGIERIVFVLHPTKNAILDHFKSGGHVEESLRKKRSLDQFPSILKYQNKAEFIATYQNNALGLGHAILCGRTHVQEDYFVVALPDDLVAHPTPCLKQMISCFKQHQASVLGLEKVAWERVHQYGIIDGQAITEDTFKIERLVEKPSKEDAPSQQSVIGRYILHQNTFNYIEQQDKGALGEVQLTDALQTLAKKEGLYGFNFKGQRLDTGQPHGFIQANLVYGLKDELYKEKIKNIMIDVQKNMSF